MNIYAVKNNSNIYFRGYDGRTNNVKTNNKIDYCIHESHFMRDIESLSFTTDYIKTEFPNGTHIADFACSKGYETYSLGVLLHNANSDKKYKITGYDITQKIIDEAKNGILNIGDFSNYHERFLSNIYSYFTPLDQNKKSIKEQFKKCFEEVPKEWMKLNICNPRYNAKVKKLVTDNQDSELTIKRIEYLSLTKDDIIRPQGKNYIPKRGVFDNIIDFKVEEIQNIDKELTKEKTGVIIFKNALYHVTGNSSNDYALVDTIPAGDLFKKTNSVLPKNGLFVMGSLHRDHLFNQNNFDNKYEDLYQNGKQIKVFKTSPIHKLLFENGFESVFYECYKDSKWNNSELNIHLPSVWKKIKHI